MHSYYLAWWNLENLFDEEGAVALGRRTDKVQRAIGTSIKGWTPQLRDRKIHQLASVIAQMNDGKGPDLMGMCELENRFVLDALVAAVNTALAAPRTYSVIHADTDDARGIDVAFIYDSTLFEVPAPIEEHVFFHVVMRRNATREIVQVNFRTAAGGRTWAVFGNHWPSRMGGQYESQGYRDIAGETLGYFHQRVLEVHGDDTPALAMGDFNDEPFDDSLVRHALSTRQREHVVHADSPLLWNLMWPQAGKPDGTFYFNNQPNVLDQFLVNRNMAVVDAAIHADVDSVTILKFPGTVSAFRYPQPIPFNGMAADKKDVNQNGFSDHFPIAMRVTEKG